MKVKGLLFAIIVLLIRNVFLVIKYSEEKGLADLRIKLLDYPVMSSIDLEYSFDYSRWIFLSSNKKRSNHCKDIIRELDKSLKKLSDSVLTKMQIDLWKYQSLDPIDYYQAKVAIPSEDQEKIKAVLIEFKKSFTELLKYEYILAARDSSKQSLYDTIPVDLGFIKAEFEKFQKCVTDQGEFNLNGNQLKLCNLTIIQLNLVTEYLKLHVYSLCSHYSEACRKDEQVLIENFRKRNHLM